MGYVVRKGDIVKSAKHAYTIVSELNKGGFADAFKATDETGRKVFFKQYKSPSKLVPWFKNYFTYEDQLHTRLRTDPILKMASVYAEEIFLGKAYKSDGVTLWTRNESIYQVFPFIEGNTNLEDMISKKAGEFDWEKRVYACTVFAFAMRKLHDANVIHCDLKPENVQVKYDPSIAIKYKPLLIDMDWSILSDQKAPWHGYQGYVGTVGYNSPEHLRNEAPLEASDVFTTAIILSQVLAQAHPFGSHLDAEDLTDYVLSGNNDFTGKKIPWGGSVTSEFEKLIRKALDVDPKNRPTMTDIHSELMTMCKELGKPKTGAVGKKTEKSIFEKVGKLFTSPFMAKPGLMSEKEKPIAKIVKPVVDTAKLPVTKVIKPDLPKAKTSVMKHIIEPSKITLTGDSGKFTTGMDFTIDQRVLSRVSSQARFADSVKQFSLERSEIGWRIVPNLSATNFTILNNAKLDSEDAKMLSDGDIIELMGKSSGKKAMRITVTVG